MPKHLLVNLIENFDSEILSYFGDNSANRDICEIITKEILPNGYAPYDKFLKNISSTASENKRYMATLRNAIRDNNAFMPRAKQSQRGKIFEFLDKVFDDRPIEDAVRYLYTVDDIPRLREITKNFGYPRWHLGLNAPVKNVVEDNFEYDEGLIRRVHDFLKKNGHPDSVAFAQVISRSLSDYDEQEIDRLAKLNSSLIDQSRSLLEIYQDPSYEGARHFDAVVKYFAKSQSAISTFFTLKTQHPHTRYYLKGWFKYSENSGIALAVCLNSPSIQNIICLMDELPDPEKNLELKDLINSIDQRLIWRLGKKIIAYVEGRVKPVVQSYNDYYDASEEEGLIKNLVEKTIDRYKDKLTIDHVNRTEEEALAACFARIDEKIDKAIEAFRFKYSRSIVSDKIQIDNYTSNFTLARGMKRKIIAHLGPTNSGKTHNAMISLKSAKSGMYLAPLRLLAFEGYETLLASGVKCALRTGEEEIKPDDYTHIASTIEMCDLDHVYDIAVIDEGQMLSDPDRGWAWTQALVGVAAHEIHVTGSADCLPYLTRAANLCGDELIHKSYQRKTPLHVMNYNLNLEDIMRGDAIVAFSRKSVMEIRERLVNAGMRVACVYGALGPEIRRAEADRFRNGEADVMVATDAIAMGLNLPIRRVILSATSKYDGKKLRKLTRSEVKQISGRAGRFGIFEDGLAGLLNGAGSPSFLSNHINNPIEPVVDSRLYLMPPYNAVEMASEELGNDDLAFLINYISQNAVKESKSLRPISMEKINEINNTLSMTNLDLKTKYHYLGCPINLSIGYVSNLLQNWAKSHAKSEVVLLPSMSDKFKTIDDLERAEVHLSILTGYTWLAMRWPNIYVDYEDAVKARLEVNEYIEKRLLQTSMSKRLLRDLENERRVKQQEEDFMTDFPIVV